MASFVCDYCQETLKKAKLDQHAQRCRQAAFSCIDCYKTFKGVEYRAHTTCITEVQKHHTIKNKEGQQVQGKRHQQPNQQVEKPAEVKAAVPEKRPSTKEQEDEKKASKPSTPREHLAAVLAKKQPQSLKEIKKSLKKTIKDKKQLKAAKKWLKTISFSLEGKEIRMRLE